MILHKRACACVFTDLATAVCTVYHDLCGRTWEGLAGYTDMVTAGFLQDGAAHYKHVAALFRDTGVTMVRVKPQGLHCSTDASLEVHCASSNDTVVVYTTTRAQSATPLQLQKPVSASMGPPPRWNIPGGVDVTAFALPVPLAGWWGLCFDVDHGSYHTRNTRLWGYGKQAAVCPFQGDSVMLLQIH